MINLKTVLEQTGIVRRTFYKYKKIGLLNGIKSLDTPDVDKTEAVIERIALIQYHKKKGLNLEQIMSKIVPYYIKELHIGYDTFEDEYGLHVMECLKFVLQFTDDEFKKYILEQELTDKKTAYLLEFNWPAFENVYYTESQYYLGFDIHKKQITFTQFESLDENTDYLDNIEFISDIIKDDFVRKFKQAKKDFLMNRNIEKIKKEIEDSKQK